jgi:hypothetical protein
VSWERKWALFKISVEEGMVSIFSETGQVAHEDVIETLQFLVDNPSSYRNKRLIISDPSSDYQPSRDELREMANLMRSLLKDVFPRIALVVKRDLHYGLGRMAEVFSETEGGEFRVFRDDRKARDWLEDK